MFVEELSIREFRGIRECEEPLRLSKFTVLIGRNNSGKTTVLEALSLLPYPHLDYPAYGKSKLALIADMHGGSESLIYGYSGEAVIKYIVNGHEWSMELSTAGFRGLYINGEWQGGASDIGKTVGIKGDPGTVERILREMVFFLPNDTTIITRLNDELKGEGEYRYLMVKSGANVRVARELVNKCVDDVYTEILLQEKAEPSARKELPGERVLYVKLRDLGDGIEKAILVALWLEALKPRLVLWDDFEASAHPSLIRELLAWLSEHDWQVVLATHSIDVLRALVDVSPNGAQVVLLQKSADDVLKARYLSLEELEDFFEAGQDPRYLVEMLKL